MRFRTVVRLGGKTATGIPVPEEVVEGLGKGKRPPVRATINGHTYRSTVASVDGEFMLPISAENREGAGVAAGDGVDVDIELDTDADARRFFDRLSYSKKQRLVLPIEQAMTNETRQRRIVRAVGMLGEGRGLEPGRIRRQVDCAGSRGTR